MAGKGPPPKAQRYRRPAPARGEWTPADEGGWEHTMPEPPAGLLKSSQEVWRTWFGAWWAANWTPDDLPGLRLLIRLYDRVSRGDVRRLGELRQLLDSYGVTPKGRQDRRWTPPESLGRRAPTRLDLLRARRDARHEAILGAGATGGRLQKYLNPDGTARLSAKERFGHLDDPPARRQSKEHQ